MKLLINTASTYKGGSVQVARSFLEEAMGFPEHEYHVVLGETTSRLIRQDAYPSNFFFYKLEFRPATRVFTFRSDSFFRDLERKIQPDCVFTTSGPAYWRPRCPHLMGYNLPHYIYKDSPFFSTLSLYKRLYWAFKGTMIRYFVVRDADAYVVQTNDVRDRLKKWIGDSTIYTVSNTCSDDFQRPSLLTSRLLPKRASGEFRLLMLSAWYQHKNFQVINGVCELLDHRRIGGIRFVLTLPREIFETHFTPLAKRYIYNVGQVRPEDCPSLYDQSDAVFLPTLLECFSATYAEAMSMKKPITTSGLSFARSVCGEAALYFDPLDPSDITDKILTLRDSPALQQELVDRGSIYLKSFLSARQRAEKYLELCDSLIAKK